MQRMLRGADAGAALVARLPHSVMSYEENLKRISQKFAVHSPAQYDQIFIDGLPIGHPLMSEEAYKISCWLGWSLQDLEDLFWSHFKAEMEALDADEMDDAASRDAESSRNP